MKMNVREFKQYNTKGNWRINSLKDFCVLFVPIYSTSMHLNIVNAIRTMKHFTTSSNLIDLTVKGDKKKTNKKMKFSYESNQFKPQH